MDATMAKRKKTAVKLRKRFEPPPEDRSAERRPPPEPLQKVEDVARDLNCSVSHLNKLRCVGGGPKFVKIGSAIRYRPSDVQAYIAAMVHTSTSEQAPDSADQSPTDRPATAEPL